jgi:hypothetical protein
MFKTYVKLSFATWAEVITFIIDIINTQYISMSQYVSVYKSYCTRPGRACNCMSTRASAILVHVVMVAFCFHVHPNPHTVPYIPNRYG